MLKKLGEILIFVSSQHYDQPWRAVPHPSVSAPPLSRTRALSPSLVDSLQSRSLTERDYELLLNLDNPHSTGASQRPQPPREGQPRQLLPPREGLPERLVMSLHVEPLSGSHALVVGGACCHLCRGGYVRGDWIKKLPCKHKVQCRLDVELFSLFQCSFALALSVASALYSGTTEVSCLSLGNS